MEMNKKYAIFDMDGTLVDSMPWWQGLAKEYLMKEGVEEISPEVLEKIRPLTITESAVLFKEIYGIQGTPEEMAAKVNGLMTEHYKKDIPLKPGVRQYLAGLKKQEKQLKQEINRKRKQAEALDRKLEQLIAEEERKSSERADKADGKSSTAKRSTKGYKMTKEELALSGSFAKNKGKLPFPLSGSYKIVAHFGRQQHPELRYVQTENSGIDIETTPGTRARAVFNGVVSRIFVTPGYNSTIIVRHGNYLTIYANLSEVYVRAGEKVKTGQNLGKIYSDSQDGNRTILTFQLWKERTKLNPESWLNM